MADISQYLQDILDAVFGEDVRNSIHDAIEIINDVSEVVLSAGTAVDSATSSSTGFFDQSLYLNTNTWDLWKCVGTDSWQLVGNLKGADGRGIASITKTGTSGLVDTYTITYSDSSTPTTFEVTNGADGADGADGNKWYIGNAITGTSTNPTVFSGSGIADANPNDCYMNKQLGNIYHCVSGGGPTVATWVYDFTMVGGGGGGSYTAGTGINISSADVISIDPGVVARNNIKPVTGGAVFSAIPTKIQQMQDVDYAGTPTEGYVLTAEGGVFKPKPASGGGHAMVSNLSCIPTIAAAAADNQNNKVVSAYAVGNWTNTYTKTYAVKGKAGSSTVIGTNGIGVWDDANCDGWLYLAELAGIGSLDYRVDFDYDPATFSGPQPVFGGFIIDDVESKICLKFANEIDEADTHTAVIYINVTIFRTDESVIQ